MGTGGWLVGSTVQWSVYLLQTHRTPSHDADGWGHNRPRSPHHCRPRTAWWVRVAILRGGLLPTTSHSISYSRVGLIAIFIANHRSGRILNVISFSSQSLDVVTMHSQIDPSVFS